MKSVILCEGGDDLWFLAYYLHKRARWAPTAIINSIWKNYQISALNNRQEVKCFSCGNDHVVIWSACGKDSFEKSIQSVLHLIDTYPFDPVDSIAIVRDRDDDSTPQILESMESWIGNNIRLENKTTSTLYREIDDCYVKTYFTPVIIPFSEEGAIETILKRAIKEQGEEESTIVDEADKYISALMTTGLVGNKYLSHSRLVLKARYSAVIAATNPDHSTGLFQSMVMACPWEQSSHVKEHFDVVLNAISEKESFEKSLRL